MEAPAIVQGSLAVGYRRFSALDPATPDYSGFVVQGSLTHTFAERTKVDLTLSRDVQYSFEPTEPYYLTTGFRVVVTQQLAESLDVRAIAGRDRLDYREEVHLGRAQRHAHRSREGVRRRRRLPLPAKPADGARRRICQADQRRFDRRYDRTRVFASVTYGF